MTDRQIYLDNNATTQPLPEVIDAMAVAMSVSFGNPSSTHTRGDTARRVLDQARSSVASLLGIADTAVTFTSGATEANNLAILSALTAVPPRGRIITSTTEHSSVLKICDWLEDIGHEVIRLSVNARGLVDIAQLESVIDHGADVLSIQWVNNETGVIQPIEEIADLASKNGVPLHVDAAQAFGKLKLRLDSLPIDYLSVTAHKIHGPQGVGALYVRPGRPVRPLLYGGPQESGRRAGTENLPGIAGFGQAARIRLERLEQVMSQVAGMRDDFEAQLRAQLTNVEINGGQAPRVAGSTNMRFHGVDGQALVAQLDRLGIYCSQSSACTNMRPEPSYVLRAMGLSEDEAYSSVRFGFSELNTHAQVSDAADCVIESVQRLRRFDGAGAFAA